MRISIAQTRPKKGDIASNIQKHLRLVQLASSHRADAIFFSELSLTSYEPSLASQLATHQDTVLLSDIQQLSDSKRITIGVGMPIKVAAGIQISLLIFQPGLPRRAYAKQQLHDDEKPFFVPGDEQLMLNIANTSVAPAICYESLQSSHAAMAAAMGADIYVATVAKPITGLDAAMKHYAEVAKKWSMPVLMANSLGWCDGFESAGRSAIWTNDGQLAGCLDDMTECILLYDTDTNEVIQAR